MGGQLQRQVDKLPFQMFNKPIKIFCNLYMCKGTTSPNLTSSPMILSSGTVIPHRCRVHPWPVLGAEVLLPRLLLVEVVLPIPLRPLRIGLH